MSAIEAGDEIEIVEVKHDTSLAPGMRGTVAYVQHWYEEITYYVRWPSGECTGVSPQEGTTIRITQ